MDNLTHTLCGAVLAKTPLGRMTPLAPAALLLGANLPDADVVVTLFGADEAARKAAYLLHHRGITHSLPGIVVQALLLALAIRWIERRELARRDSAAPPFRAHLLPALCGLLTHPLLDWLNNYGVRPFLPFSGWRTYADLVFIVDPWLWLVFGGTAALAGLRTRLGHWTWGALALAAVLFLGFHPRSPDLVRLVFPAAVALVALARRSGVGARRPSRVLAAGGALAAGYVALLAVCGERAVAQVRADPALAAQFRMRSPVIADPWSWSVALEDATTIRWQRVGVGAAPAQGAPSPAGTSASGAFGIPVVRGLDDPRVRLAAARPEAAAWRSFARLPFAWVEPRPGGAARVHIADARYLTHPDPESWVALPVDLTPAEVAAASAAP
ncbi:MAG: metal-dependent hydrolase [Planctomycetes bacterium]|nr:metal-dependent hydrolase [Planctomycetota bacterium]